MLSLTSLSYWKFGILNRNCDKHTHEPRVKNRLNQKIFGSEGNFFASLSSSCLVSLISFRFGCTSTRSQRLDRNQTKEEKTNSMFQKVNDGMWMREMFSQQHIKRRRRENFRSRCGAYVVNENVERLADERATKRREHSTLPALFIVFVRFSMLLLSTSASSLFSFTLVFSATLRRVTTIGNNFILEFAYWQTQREQRKKK